MRASIEAQVLAIDPGDPGEARERLHYSVAEELAR